MPAKRIIPCLDVYAGRVVKGVRFVDLRDAGDPAELAAAYDRASADEIVFLDITASHEERRTLLDAVARTADEVFIPLTVGGGGPAERHGHAVPPREERRGRPARVRQLPRLLRSGLRCRPSGSSRASTSTPAGS